jgi:uncharacterized RDD family membrane protein YckC
MAFCAYCGREISEQALTCPNCGHPNERRTAIPEVQFTPADPDAVREYAGFWIRFAGLLLDVILIVIVTAPFGHTVDVGEQHFRVVYNEYASFLHFFYAWLMIGLVRGQTLGAMAAGVRVTRPNGDSVGLGRAAARAGMAIVSGLVLGLGYLWAAWDREKRTWHDMVADTRVYRVSR